MFEEYSKNPLARTHIASKRQVRNWCTAVLPAYFFICLSGCQIAYIDSASANYSTGRVYHTSSVISGYILGASHSCTLLESTM